MVINPIPTKFTIKLSALMKYISPQQITLQLQWLFHIYLILYDWYFFKKFWKINFIIFVTLKAFLLGKNSLAFLLLYLYISIFAIFCLKFCRVYGFNIQINHCIQWLPIGKQKILQIWKSRQCFIKTSIAELTDNRK